MICFTYRSADQPRAKTRSSQTRREVRTHNKSAATSGSSGSRRSALQAGDDGAAARPPVLQAILPASLGGRIGAAHGVHGPRRGPHSWIRSNLQQRHGAERLAAGGRVRDFTNLLRHASPVVDCWRRRTLIASRFPTIFGHKAGDFDHRSGLDQSRARPASRGIVVTVRHVGLWRSWERASMAWKRSGVRTSPGPPNLLKHLQPLRQYILSACDGVDSNPHLHPHSLRLPAKWGGCFSWQPRSPWLLAFSP